MTVTRLQILQWQFRMAWSLAADVCLPKLTDEMCMWKPHAESWTVHKSDDGRWVADWSEPDPADPAPPSIGWLTWHLLWWWADAIEVVRGGSRAERQSGAWPGTAAAVVEELTSQAETWTAICSELSDERLDNPVTFPWPDPRPMTLLLGWVNMELMKNVAEIAEVINMYSHRSGD